MFDVHKGGNTEVEPNTIAFTTVCDAWSKSNVEDAVERVDYLIQWMKKLSESGYNDVYPNEYTYACLLTAISRCKDPDKATKAIQILRFMSSEKIKVNSFIYNNILLACSKTQGNPTQRLNAIKIAIEVFEEALDRKESIDRIYMTFVIFFQACGNLTQNEAEKAHIEKIVEIVFKRCCDRGLVDRKLLSHFRSAATQQLYLRLFGAFKTFPKVELKDIPREWKVNTRQNKPNYSR